MSDPSSVTIGEFIRHFGRYHDEARQKPLTLTKHGRASLVVLSAEHFDRLTLASDQRRSWHVSDLTPDMAAIMLNALEAPDD